MKSVMKFFRAALSEASAQRKKTSADIGSIAAAAVTAVAAVGGLVVSIRKK